MFSILLLLRFRGFAVRNDRFDIMAIVGYESFQRQAVWRGSAGHLIISFSLFLPFLLLLLSELYSVGE